MLNVTLDSGETIFDQCFAFGRRELHKPLLVFGQHGAEIVIELANEFRMQLTVAGAPAVSVLPAGALGTCVAYYLMGITYEQGITTGSKLART